MGMTHLIISMMNIHAKNKSYDDRRIREISPRFLRRDAFDKIIFFIF
jgi:hypothetical protein